MLRLREPSTDWSIEIDDAGPVLRRLHLDLAAGRLSGSLHALRIHLVADVLARTLEFRGAQVLQLATLPDPAESIDLPSELSLAALGIQAPPAVAGSEARPSAFRKPADVRLAGPEAAGDGAMPPALAVGVVKTDNGDGYDEPLALRLVLLSVGYHEAVVVDGVRLAEAHETLERWRRRVAEWASGPSGAPDQATVSRCSQYLDDDLDTPSVLAALNALENDPDIAPGTKFETFSILDRVLALELPRDIGRYAV